MLKGGLSDILFDNVLTGNLSRVPPSFTQCMIELAPAPSHPGQDKQLREWMTGFIYTQ